MDRKSASLKAVFCRALEFDSTAERAAYLAKVGADDNALRAEVEELLLAHNAAGDFLDDGPLVPERDLPSEPQSEHAGMAIGRYKLLEQLAEGGMGMVYVAEQQTPIVRKVALKIIKPGLDTREVIARFEMERQVLALMDHPHIARVLDVGTTDSGRPYFVMELVRGIPITEFCDQRQFTSRERLQLFVQVCQAIQHAHQKGIIHRDIKPSNVLVTVQDGKPFPKVIDFGVAKAIDQQLTDQTAFTRCAQVIGTPLYMSPEQAELKSADVDTRTDVYSLGVLLYELLTGTTPFPLERMRGAGFDEMRRILREEEPPRPSARVTTLRATCTTACPKCQGEPRRLSHSLRGELDCIVMTAIDKDRARRYDSVGSLAADVQRYLDHQPILARPASLGHHVCKWLRRHPALALVILALHVCGVILLCGALWHFYEMRVALTVASQLRTESQRNEQALRAQLYATDVALAWQAWTEGDLRAARELTERHQPKRGFADLRGFEWHLLEQRLAGELLTFTRHAAPILAADASPDDRWLASSDRGGAVIIWDFATGRALRTLRYGSQEVTSVCFSPDGRTLATAGQDQTVRLWDTTNWTETACLRGHTRTVCCVAWSPDGQQLASCGRDQTVKIWDGATHREVRALPEHADVVRCVAWSPDGKLLATAGGETTVRLWDTTSWELQGSVEGHDKGVLALAFSPRGDYLASGGYSHQLILHDVTRRAEAARTIVPGAIWSLVFSADGELLLAGAGDGLLSVFSTRNLDRGLEKIRDGIGHSGTLRAMFFALHGRTLVTASEDDRTLKTWPAASLTGRRIHAFRGTVLAVAPERNTAAVLDGPRTLRLIDFPEDQDRLRFPECSQDITGALFSPQGRWLAVTHSSREVQLWDLTSQPCSRRKLAAEHPVNSVVFSPRSALLAGSGERGLVTLWQVGQDAQGITLRGMPSDWTAMAFSPDESLLATGSMSSPDVDIWQVADGKRRLLLRGSQPVVSLAFSPGGTTVAVGGEYGSVSLLGLIAHQEPIVLRGHEGHVRQVAFSDDGHTLASFDSNATVRLWHMPTRRALITLLKYNRPLNWLAFASRERLLIGVAPDASGRGDVLEFEATSSVP